MNTDQFGFKTSTKWARAAQMYVRPEGASQDEVALVLGHPHLNMLKRVREQGHTVTRNKKRTANGRLRTVYHIKVVEVV